MTNEKETTAHFTFIVSSTSRLLLKWSCTRSFRIVLLCIHKHFFDVILKLFRVLIWLNKNTFQSGVLVVSCVLFQCSRHIQSVKYIITCRFFFLYSTLAFCCKYSLLLYCINNELPLQLWRVNLLVLPFSFAFFVNYDVYSGNTAYYVETCIHMENRNVKIVISIRWENDCWLLNCAFFTWCDVMWCEMHWVNKFYYQLIKSGIYSIH